MRERGLQRAADQPTLHPGDGGDVREVQLDVRTLGLFQRVADRLADRRRPRGVDEVAVDAFGGAVDVLEDVADVVGVEGLHVHAKVVAEPGDEGLQVGQGRDRPVGPLRASAEVGHVRAVDQGDAVSAVGLAGDGAGTFRHPPNLCIGMALW